MANRKFIFVILAAALVFGTLAVGCDNGDTWVPVTSLVEVDGNWKALTSSEGTNLAGTLTTKTKVESTLVIRAGTTTMTEKTTTELTYSGTRVDNDNDWKDFRDALTGAALNPKDDTYGRVYTFGNRTATYTTEDENTALKVTDFRGALLSPDGRSLLRGGRVYVKQ
jgi:hypothetical protein